MLEPINGGSRGKGIETTTLRPVDSNDRWLVACLFTVQLIICVCVWFFLLLFLVKRFIVCPCVVVVFWGFLLVFDSI